MLTEKCFYLFQGRFEDLFYHIDDSVSFQYFKSFRRVRVNFATHEQASTARDKVHMTEFGGEVIKGYFTQVRRRLTFNTGVIMRTDIKTKRM